MERDRMITDDDATDKSNLLALFDEASSTVPSNKRSAYHLRTIKNYITHFDKIGPYNRKKVNDTLVRYLTIVKEGFNIENIDESVEVFQEFISPLINIYQEEAGFTTYVQNWLLCIWFIIVGGLIFLVTRSLIALEIVAFLFGLYFIHKLKRSKMGKVHGFKY